MGLSQHFDADNNKDKEKSHMTPEQEAGDEHITPCRVLLVEDDLDDQILARKRLKHSHLVEDVICFSNGVELSEYLKQQGFEDRSVMCFTPLVIVLDLNMPRMNGFEVLKNLKSDPFTAEIPVIVVSDTQSKEEIERAFQLKANAVFRKPLNATRLQAFLRSGWKWPMEQMWVY